MYLRFVLPVSALTIACSVPNTAPTNLHQAAPLEVTAAPMEAPEGIRPTPASRCPKDMVEVEGSFCPTVQEDCLKWVDSHGLTVDPPKPGKTGRCGEYKYPSKCLSDAKEMVSEHYCIDRYEYPNVEGQIPATWMNWHDVKNACASEGKRLCTKTEWTFSCEGKDIHPQPYPYGDGYHRDTGACNFDNDFPEDPSRSADPKTGERPKINVFNAKSKDTPTAQVLKSLLVPSGSLSSCVSPFGVFDQVGNADEEVFNETHVPHDSGLVGGHVFGWRNACRPMTAIHDEYFSWYETGGRCCSDLPSDGPPV